MAEDYNEPTPEPAPETELVPEGLVTYQFSARGHDMIQAILAEHISHPHDGATVYYRSRPFVLAQGLTPEESMAASMARSGGVHGGRDIGVVHCLTHRRQPLQLFWNVAADTALAGCEQ